jgi:sorbitol-specific phosphotransferase system component IIC
VTLIPVIVTVTVLADNTTTEHTVAYLPEGRKPVFYAAVVKACGTILWLLHKNAGKPARTSARLGGPVTFTVKKAKATK